MGVCYRLVKAVDISPMLAALPARPITAVNVGGRGPGKSPCAVVLGTLPPIVSEFVAGLGLGGSTKRILLRKLAPRQGMAPHIDQWMPAEANWKRFQVPLTSHPDIIMRWPDDDVSVHLAPGFLYEIRFDRLHEVVNGADVERVHLQVDQVDATI